MILKIIQENNGLVQSIKELEVQVEGLKHVTSEPSAAQTPGLQEVPNVFQNPAVHTVKFDSVDAGIPATPQTSSILGSSAEGWAQLKGINQHIDQQGKEMAEKAVECAKLEGALRVVEKEETATSFFLWFIR